MLDGQRTIFIKQKVQTQFREQPTSSFSDSNSCLTHYLRGLSWFSSTVRVLPLLSLPLVLCWYLITLSPSLCLSWGTVSSIINLNHNYSLITPRNKRQKVPFSYPKWWEGKPQMKGHWRWRRKPQKLWFLVGFHLFHFNSLSPWKLILRRDPNECFLTISLRPSNILDGECCTLSGWNDSQIGLSGTRDQWTLFPLNCRGQSYCFSFCTLLSCF